MRRRAVLIGLLLLFGAGAACSSFSEEAAPELASDAGPDATIDDATGAPDAADASDGKVDPNVELFAANQGPIRAMVADGDSLYWAPASNGALVMRRSFDADGGVQALVGTDNAVDIAVDDAYLYWTDSVNLTRTPKDGGEPLLIDDHHQTSIVVDDTNIYYSDAVDGYVHRRPTASLSSDMSYVTVSDPSAIALDDTYVFVVSNSGGLQAYRKSASNPPAMSLDSPTDFSLQHSRIAAGGGAVFFRSKVLNLESIDVHGNGVRTTISDAGAAVSVGSDGTNVFWTEDSAPDGGAAVGRVRRATASGAAATDLATGQLHPSLIVAARDHVYWVVAETDGTSSIMRRAN